MWAPPSEPAVDEPAAAEIESWPSQDAASAGRAGATRGGRVTRLADGAAGSRRSRGGNLADERAGAGRRGRGRNLRARVAAGGDRGSRWRRGCSSSPRRGRGGDADRRFGMARGGRRRWRGRRRDSIDRGCRAAAGRGRGIPGRRRRGSRRSGRGRAWRPGCGSGRRREHAVPAVRDGEPTRPRLLPQLRPAARRRGRFDDGRAPGHAGGQRGVPSLRDAQPRRRRLLPELWRQPAWHGAGLRPARRRRRGGGRRPQPWSDAEPCSARSSSSSAWSA